MFVNEMRASHQHISGIRDLPVHQASWSASHSHKNNHGVWRPSVESLVEEFDPSRPPRASLRMLRGRSSK